MVVKRELPSLPLAVSWFLQARGPLTLLKGRIVGIGRTVELDLEVLRNDGWCNKQLPSTRRRKRETSFQGRSLILHHTVEAHINQYLLSHNIVAIQGSLMKSPYISIQAFPWVLTCSTELNIGNFDFNTEKLCDDSDTRCSWSCLNLDLGWYTRSRFDQLGTWETPSYKSRHNGQRHP